MNHLYLQLILFYYIAHFASFTKAAKFLNFSKAHASKQLSDLERTVGSALLHRNTRSLKLTFAGEVLFKHAETIIHELQLTENTINTIQNEIKGTLRVTSPQGYADYLLAPHIPEFIKKHPDIVLDMIHTGDYLNLIEEKIDVAIRITHEPPLDRVAKKIGMDHMVLCCSRKYIKQFGQPQTPSDLTQHQCLVYSPQKARNNWPFYESNLLTTIHVKPTISSNSIPVLLAAAVQSQGIARLPLFVIQEYLNTDTIQTILREFDPPGTPIYAIFAQGRIIPPRIQAFVTFLEKIHTTKLN